MPAPPQSPVEGGSRPNVLTAWCLCEQGSRDLPETVPPNRPAGCLQKALPPPSPTVSPPPPPRPRAAANRNPPPPPPPAPAPGAEAVAPPRVARRHHHPPRLDAQRQEGPCRHHGRPRCPAWEGEQQRQQHA